jgi:hypothetical protein
MKNIEDEFEMQSRIINKVWDEDEPEALSQHDVSKRKFAVEWMRNVNYGIGSGTEYFDAETREEALKLFWNGKNKEAFEVNTIYVC